MSVEGTTDGEFRLHMCGSKATVYNMLTGMLNKLGTIDPTARMGMGIKLRSCVMKFGFMAGMAAAAALVSASPAAAQVQFTGTTAGCFGTNCAPTAGTATLGGLTFTSGTFNQATNNTGFLALGGLSDGLGTFNLSGAPFDYTGSVFRLLVSFTAPTAVVGNGTFDSLLEGTVTGVNSGGIDVNFDNSARLFTSNSGPFSLRINDVSLSSNSSTQIVSGVIRAAVPEPGTWGMMLVGFGAIGYSMRRRKKAIMQLA